MGPWPIAFATHLLVKASNKALAVTHYVVVKQLEVTGEPNEARAQKLANDGAQHTKVQYEEQDLTSFSGLVLFQALFQRLRLRDRLKACVRGLVSRTSYGLETVLSLLVVHLLLGWRRLRDLDYYRDDPLVLRVLGLQRLPDVSTVTRGLRRVTASVVGRLHRLNRKLVLNRVRHQGLVRLTLDFDGSVLSTKSRTTEGTAVGFNPKAKGARSYYPLFGTVAQTSQVLDLLHRPGNVHDSNGALGFIQACVRQVRESGFRGALEARLDCAHFSDAACFWLDQAGLEFSISVPFERFPQLKEKIEGRRRWQRINEIWSSFEATWKPRQWERSYRCIVYRQRLKTPRKGPIQLELFTPVHWQYEYKVVLTNKTGTSGTILEFHNGRGAQEALFAQLKSQVQMDYLPTRRLTGNQTYLLCAVLAHNLYRELQMFLSPARPSQVRNRAAHWVFEQASSIRKRLIQRAGRLIRPQGVLTLSLSPNPATADELTRYLKILLAPA